MALENINRKKAIAPDLNVTRREPIVWSWASILIPEHVWGFVQNFSSIYKF